MTFSSSSSEAGSTVGIDVPEIVSNFVNSANLRSRMPIRFVLKNRPFILDVQYFLDILNSTNIDVLNARLRFAVTTDGFELLVSLKSAELEILQDEFGDIDSLGILMTDLIEADTVSI